MNTPISREAIVRIANAIFLQRYPDAAVMFAAGSLVRAEGTSTSDLDLVVVFNRLPNAYRESFRFDGLPVEAFVHDPETLNYFFFEMDRLAGIPALPQMVIEGIEIPEPNSLSRSLKGLATDLLSNGPPQLSVNDERKLRYGITDLVDDLREPRSHEELVAIGSELYEVLADYYLRVNGLWSGRGKSIPRALERMNLAVRVKFCGSFEDLFQRQDSRSVIALVEDWLRPHGGLLFEGHRLDAPAEWRRPLK